MPDKKQVIGELRLSNVRLSFPHLFVPQPGIKDPKTGVTSEPRWGAAFLIPKKTAHGKAQFAKYKAARDEAKAAKWGDPKNWPSLKPERLCMRDGDLESYDGYKDHWYLASSRPTKTRDGQENAPPALVDRDPNVNLKRTDGKLYAGCFVNAVVRIWAQDDPAFGKRLNCSLEAVQWHEHGEPFGATPVDPKTAFQNTTADFPEEEQSIAEEEEDLVG